MNIEEYHKMHALERSYWWFQGRRRVLLTMLDWVLGEVLGAGRRKWNGNYGKHGNGENGAGGERRAGRKAPARMLDIGCGTGMLLEDLGARGFAAGLDFSPVALTYCREHGLGNLGRADVRHLPLRSDSIDLITAIDLVEHIQDDVGLMGEFFRVLRPGGVALLSVPAHPALWSAHDVALHHFRRYRKRDFRALVENAGLRPLRYTYTMGVAYGAAIVFRPLKRLLQSAEEGTAKTDEFRIPRVLNSALYGVLRAEARLLKHTNLPIGLSLLCVAQKPGEE